MKTGTCTGCGDRYILVRWGSRLVVRRHKPCGAGQRPRPGSDIELGQVAAR